MISDPWSFAALVSTGAALMIVHLATLVGALQAELPWRRRLWALLPPMAPVVAWWSGRRGIVILWGFLLITYVVLFFLL